MSTEYAEARHAVEIALKVDLAGAPSAVKCDALEFWIELQNLVDAGTTSALAAFEATQEHQVEGHSSPVGWVKSHCRHEGRDIARLQRLSRSTKRLPLAQAALARGEITRSHIERLRDAQRKVGEEAFALAEAVLVDAAIEQRFSDFARTLEYFIVRARPADADARRREQIEDRHASSSRTYGGVGIVDAQFEPIGFTRWDGELRRCYDHLLERDRAAARAELGRRPLESELGRTARQRRADAMLLMADRSAAYDGDELPASRMTLVVHGDADLVGRLVDFLLDDLANGDPDAAPDLSTLEYGPQSLHELDDGTVVTVNTILLALLTGVVRGILFDPEGEILRFGHARRLFSPAQAMALRAKYRRCCHPHGCDQTGARLQSDHVVEYADGGPTDVANGQPLDSAHNLDKTNNKHRPPPERPDRGQRRRPPVTGPLPR